MEFDDINWLKKVVSTQRWFLMGYMDILSKVIKGPDASEW